MFLDFYYAGIGMEMKWRRTMTLLAGKSKDFNNSNPSGRRGFDDDLETRCFENDTIKIRDEKQNSS
jgi:hypothetical protein